MVSPASAPLTPACRCSRYGPSVPAFPRYWESSIILSGLLQVRSRVSSPGDVTSPDPVAWPTSEPPDAYPNGYKWLVSAAGGRGVPVWGKLLLSSSSSVADIGSCSCPRPLAPHFCIVRSRGRGPWRSSLRFPIGHGTGGWRLASSGGESRRDDVNVGKMGVLGAVLDEEKVIDLLVCNVVAGNSVSREGLDHGPLRHRTPKSA